jgi:DNA-binding HxlR family transcriptional regulator
LEKQIKTVRIGPVSHREYSQSCSLACALDRIGERWSLLIVRELSLGPMRFSDLARSVGGAPTDVITKRLRDLEQHGIIRRRQLGPPASAIVYELTDLGRGLERPMLELGRWGLNFEEATDVERLSPTSLAHAVRIILRPSPDFAMTLGLRSGGQAYRLRIEDGWIDASRAEPDDAELTLSGEPRGVLEALVFGEAGEAEVEIEGDREVLEVLRSMVELPDRLREEALGAQTATVAAPA